jgi:predicted dehydrogenase
MQKQYRVGIIGRTGHGDYGHGLDVACTKVPRFHIAAVADEDAAGRENAQQRTGATTSYADYRTMLSRERLDMVVICPRWIDQHRDMLLAAAEAGCHIYIEKPFCPTLADCDEVCAALEMRHLHLAIAQITQYSPILAKVKQLIDSGEIGEVLELRCRGKEDRRGGGEDLWVLGSHVLGMMRTLAGGQPLECTAVVRQNRKPPTKTEVVSGAEGLGLLTGDHVQARYRFASGAEGFFGSKRNMAGTPSRFALQVFGSRGIIEIESGYAPPAAILRDSGWSPARSGKSWEPISSNGIGQPETMDNPTYEGGHIAALLDLVESIETQRPTRCSAAEARDITEMIVAVFESQRLGTSVPLPLTTRVNPLSLWT